jgi:hypothetical protein
MPHLCAVFSAVKTCLACSAMFQQLRKGDFHEHEVCVKFCFKLLKMFAETFEMLKKHVGMKP